ncbi:MAG: glycoside hydrolase family 99-like domain-containing protein [Syntrophaceae bacterium]
MHVLFSLEPLYELNSPCVMDTWLQWFSHMHTQLSAVIPGYHAKLLAFDNIVYRNNKDFLGDRVLLSQAEIRDNWRFKGSIFGKIERGAIDHEIENYICKTVKEKLDGFTPEVVILLNDSPWLRKVFPNAAFLYIEVAWLHRAPYPNHWQIDPLGLGKGKILEIYPDEIMSHIEYTDVQRDFTAAFKRMVRSKIGYNRDAADCVASFKKRFSEIVLLPMASRFPFDSDTPIFAWIDRFLQDAPSERGYLFTEHPLTPSLQAGEVSYLEAKYGNVYFDGRSRAHIGTQALIPHVDAVYGDFSSVGNQALFFDIAVRSFVEDIKLEIPYNTFLNPINRLVAKADAEHRDRTLYWLLTHSDIPANKLFDGQWLLDFIKTACACHAAHQPWVQFTKPICAMDEWQRDEWCRGFTLLSPTGTAAQARHATTATAGPEGQAILQPVRPSYPPETSVAPGVKDKSRVRLPTDSTDRFVRTIAFYLPQYHPIPENDQWWGKGFTEWTNVAKAKPLFESHYQPHIPADLGFYDLRLAEVREAQAELAKEYGISGFCYYHYWFNGKRLLHRVLDEVLESGRPDFPFCLCWANENWTRAWDGRQGEVLIQQNYNEEDDRNHIRWLLKVFRDKRYIRIDDRPLMLVYLSKSIPDPARSMQIWREEAEEAGEALYLCKVESAPWEYGAPGIRGFDACIEFQPDWGNLGPVRKQLSNGHIVFDYAEIVDRMLNKPVPPYKRFPCVTPMWDNSPRRKQGALIIDNSTPDHYERWLNSVVNKLDTFQLDDHIIFINAWNEWGESNHLEPDMKNGRAYLEATKRALKNAPVEVKSSTRKMVSILILTCNGLEYTKKCVESLQKYTPDPHEIIFVDNGSTDGTVQWLRTLVDENSHYELIENEHNHGFAAGNNQALKKAKGDYILLLNNDVLLTEGWLERLIYHIEQSSDFGMVGPMSNSVSGPQVVQPVPYDNDDMQAMQKFARYFTGANFGRISEQMRLVGFCLLVKKEVFNIIGGLDENYRSGNFEDDDLCLRAFIAGYKNIIAHDVFIHHYGSMTFKGNAIDYSATMRDNRQHFASKWKDIVEFDKTGYRVNLTKDLQLKKILEWGEERFAQGELAAAAMVFERALILDKTNVEALNNLGVIQWQIGHLEAAMNTFQIALSLNPKDPDALANLVQAAIDTGRFDLIKQDLLAAVKQAQPESPDLMKLINAKQDSGGTA